MSNEFDYTVDFTKAKDKRKRETILEGYVWNDSYDMAEHRVVAFIVLGRMLDPDEHVHHIDHNKSNNLPENLVVLAPLAHNLVHLFTSLLSPLRNFKEIPHGPSLMSWDKLKEFLDGARIKYEYLGPGGEL